MDDGGKQERKKEEEEQITIDVGEQRDTERKVGQH